jgi:hypothetical protein
MASPFALCDACDDPHAAKHMCITCAVGERLLCDKFAEMHKVGKKTKAHVLLTCKDASCQMCDDPHAATHWCAQCEVDEQFLCRAHADTHKLGKKTKAHTLFVLPDHYQHAVFPAAQATIAAAADAAAADAGSDSEYEEYVF